MIKKKNTETLIGTIRSDVRKLFYDGYVTFFIIKWTVVHLCCASHKSEEEESKKKKRRRKRRLIKQQQQK